ncbi:MAG: HEAT repeat domain-containing protein [Candidatus Riflebacteria bacterium]|nr:HEAT repeat domain-containing protein [Candidatus Riflebacteria bacterium]
MNDFLLRVLRSSHVMCVLIFLICTVDAYGVGHAASLNDTVKGLLSKKTAAYAYNKLASMGLKAVPGLQAMLSADNLRLIRAALDLAEKFSISDIDGSTIRGLGQNIIRIIVNPRFGGLRVRAVQLLGRFGPAINNSLPVLVNALSDPNAGLRKAAAEAAFDVFLRGRLSLSGLEQSLKDPKNPTRKFIISGLEQYGAALHPALPLVAVFADKGSLDAADVMELAIPRLLPIGRLGLLQGLFVHSKAGVADSSDLFGTIPELANAIAQDKTDSMDPDSPAVGEDTSAADQAETAVSFEDIPAGD